MFSIAINALPSLSSVDYYGSHPFYCAVCKQRFQTEKNFNRHNNSRKHSKQIEIIRDGAFRVAGRNIGTTAKLDLLPNEVIDDLVTDLTNQVAKKDDFFNEIQLLEDNELDIVSSSIQPQHWTMKTTAPPIYRPKQLGLNRIPTIYPCLMCFQSLDSQKNFDEHMLKSHFHRSISAE